MGFGTPGFNPHAPGPIGDTTPATLAGTTLALTSTSTQFTINNSPSVFTCAVDAFGDVTWNIVGGNNYIFFSNGGQGNFFVGPNTYGGANGSALKLGNSAVTGLAAGALAALTNASLTIQDATGTTYRIPVIV